jgi:dTDP-glucose pyrophosphorylase
MTAPHLVLCMAGIYKRFRDAGYQTPKYLLPIGDVAVLTCIVRGLAPRSVLLVMNQRDAEFRDVAVAAVLEGGAEEVDVLIIGDTGGQAETAILGARRLIERGWAGPLVFHNVDTVLRGRSLTEIGEVLTRCEGFIDVFSSESPAYSYVRLEGDRVMDIREKEVISHHATSGLYGFASAARYLAAAVDCPRRSKGEFYISDVYRQLLDAGADVRANPDRGGFETRVLGTPAEYEQAVAEGWR